VAAGKEGDQSLVDNLVLAEDDPADALAHQRKTAAEGVDLGQELAGIFRRWR
jgi:hypothetical protein